MLLPHLCVFRRTCHKSIVWDCAFRRQYSFHCTFFELHILHLCFILSFSFYSLA